MNKPSTPNYSSFRSLLQAKLKGYWRVQSLERLKGKIHKGDPYAQRLKKKIERNSSFYPPDFIQFKRCVSFTQLSSQNQSLQCDITPSESKSFFFTQTQKKLTLDKEQRKSNLLLNIFSNNERELSLYNSLPFVAIQGDIPYPRKFKEVVRESRILKRNEEYFSKASLFFQQINNKALKNSFQKELSNDSHALQDALNESNQKESSIINMFQDIQNYQQGNSYPNTALLFQKRKLFNYQRRNESSLCLKNRFRRNQVILNKSNFSFAGKTNNRNSSGLSPDKSEKKTSGKPNSKEINPSSVAFIHKELNISQSERKTIFIKGNNMQKPMSVTG